MNDRLDELMGDPDFVQALLQCQTAQEIGALFTEYQIELAPAQLRVITDQLSTLLEDDGEMSDEALENVAGGRTFAGLHMSAALRAQIRKGPRR